MHKSQRENVSEKESLIIRWWISITHSSPSSRLQVWYHLQHRQQLRQPLSFLKMDTIQYFSRSIICPPLTFRYRSDAPFSQDQFLHGSIHRHLLQSSSHPLLILFNLTQPGFRHFPCSLISYIIVCIRISSARRNMGYFCKLYFYTVLKFLC